MCLSFCFTVPKLEVLYTTLYSRFEQNVKAFYVITGIFLSDFYHVMHLSLKCILIEGLQLFQPLRSGREARRGGVCIYIPLTCDESAASVLVIVQPLFIPSC